MKIAFLPQRLPRLAYLLFGAFETFAFVAAFSGAGASAASCTPPATDYGTDTIQQSVTTAGTYTVWSHLFAPTGSTGSYMLEVDDGGGNATCYSVGGSSVAANAWTWVNWQNTPSSVISANLTAGQYTFKLIGNSPDVELDNILLTTDTSCTPTDDGSNCSSPAPAPTVNLSADPTSVTSGDSSTLTWSSTDANSCNSSWNGTEATSGTASTGALSATTSFTLTCTGTGGTASQTATVTVTPPDGGGGGTNPTAPTISLGVQDGATVSGTTDVTVTPSNDVTQVVYSVDGAAVNTTTTAPFSYNWDTTQVNDGVHSLSATASNAAGGTATASVSVAVQNGAGGTGTGTGGGNDGGGSSDTGTGGGGSDTGGSSDQGGGDSGSSGGGGGFGDSFGLDAPTNVSASLGALDTTSLSYPVTVTWSTTDGATGYDIVLDGATIDEVDSGDTTSYDYMLPADGSTHTFQIVAFDDFGDVSDLSDGATVDASLTGNGSGATVTVPSGLKAVPSGKAQQVNLSWTDDDPSVKSYVVYRGDGSNPGSYTKVGTSKTITYGDTTVKAGSTYSYYVVAVNAGGDQSDQSSSANATVSTSQASGGGGDGGTVVGIIRASDGHKPIIGAQVMFALSGKTYVFTTDGDGMYVIPDMGSGPYTISFS
ncbi:MAG TPA: Ig-like domain-containing protein, partial [Candidatus Saccharimonadales bacterium]